MINTGYMSPPRPAIGVLAIGLTLSGSAVVSGQGYPTKPIRMFTSTAGGGTDFATRIVAQGLTGPLVEPVIVENRVAIISIETVSKAPPNRYTLLFAGITLWIVPLLQNVSYDTVRDFAPITFTGRSPAVLLVHPSLPVKSVKELISLAKTKPGQLNYSSGGA